MTIRRHITTTIDEIDDSEDSLSPTNLTIPNTGVSPSQAQVGTPIDFPDSNEDKSETYPSHSSPVPQPTVGRTFPDLVVEFKNDYRAMAVLLTIIPFIIFVAKIDSIESLKYPLILSILLNLLWFVTPLFAALCRRFKK